MKIALIAPDRDLLPWKKVFSKLVPKAELFLLEDFSSISNPISIDLAILWKQPKAIFTKMDNVKLIASMGAGADHLFQDDTVPRTIPWVRIVDSKLSNAMADYVLMAAISIEKKIPQTIRSRADKDWKPYFYPPQKPIIGVVGTGEIGLKVIQKLQLNGFEVKGLSKSGAPKKNVEIYSLHKEEQFFSQVDVVVNVLPLTPETHDFYNKDRFMLFKKGASFVNIGRGAHVDENALLQVVNNNHLTEVYLDVVKEEPLPACNLLWNESRIMITPHIAAITAPEDGAKLILDNYTRLINNEALIHVLHPEKGY